MAAARQVWLWIGLGAFSVLALPAACFFPDYTFTEQEAAASGSSSGSGGASVSTSSTLASGSSQGGASTVASSNTTTASSGTGGTGGAAVEDCLNAKDDDGDGDIDCTDTDCQAGYACVPAAPVGWNNGYVTLFVGTPGQEPNCPASFPSSSPYTGINGISFTAATCDPCGCDTPTGQTCQLPIKIDIVNTACGTSPSFPPRVLTLPANWDGTCSAPDAYPGGDNFCSGPCNVSARATAATVAGGSCMAHGGTPTITPVNWNASAKGCGNAAIGAGCAGAEVCQPIPPGEPFLTGLCVFKEGDNTCPSGPFADRHLFYENVMDTRDCTTCQCGAPTGSTCNVSLSVYSDLNQTCSTSLTTFNAGGCGNLTGNPVVAGRKGTISPPSGGSCTASGGQPSGTVTPAVPTTFCCIP